MQAFRKDSSLTSWQIVRAPVDYISRQRTFPWQCLIHLLPWQRKCSQKLRSREIKWGQAIYNADLSPQILSRGICNVIRTWQIRTIYRRWYILKCIDFASKDMIFFNAPLCESLHITPVISPTSAITWKDTLVYLTVYSAKFMVGI